MITDVTVFTPRVTTPPFPITDGNVDTDPIQVRNIDGLDPVVADVNTSRYGSVDGEFYNGSSTGKRNIVLTVGLNPDWSSNQSFEGLRKILYAYFMPKNQVKLRIESTHMATVEIVGYVESFEANIFSKDPEYQISIICPQSEFIAVAATVVPGTTVLLPDGDPTPFEYQGTLPTGFTLEILPTTGVGDFDGEFRVLNENPSLGLFIASGKVDATQHIEMSTLRGNKYLKQISDNGGQNGSLLNGLSTGSSWLQLDEGINNFRVASSVAGLTWKLTYFAKYGGI